jgi:hypothetical protein
VTCTEIYKDLTIFISYQLKRQSSRSSVMAKGSDEEMLMNNNSDSEGEQPATTRRSTRKERGSGAHGSATLHGNVCFP